MATPLTLVLFCSTAGFSAGSPRKPNQNLNFNLPPKSDKIDEENEAVFADPNVRGANFNISGVTPEVIGQFATAPRVKVTIEIMEE